MLVVFEEVDTYVLFRQNTIALYIATHPILELYMVSKQQPGAQVTRRWLDQDGLDLGLKEGRTAE